MLHGREVEPLARENALGRIEDADMAFRQEALGEGKRR